MKENAIKDQSKAFAVRIVRLYRYLHEDKKEWVLSKQLLRSGTSIGANVVEALASISKKSFWPRCIFLSKNVARQSIGLNCFMILIISMVMNLNQSVKIILP